MLHRLAVLALLCCAACDSPVEPQPGRSSIRIEPNPPPIMIAGMSFTLSIATSGDLAVGWSSRDSTVAVVSPAGVVTARKEGRTYIVASGLEDTTVRDSVAVTVMAEPPIVGGTPTVYVDWIRDGTTGALVNRDAVRGFVEVGARTDVPPSLTQSMIRITLNDEPVCAEPFAGRQRFIHRCAFDSRRFPNGVVTVRAEGVLPSGVIFAVSTAQSLTLAN